MRSASTLSLVSSQILVGLNASAEPRTKAVGRDNCELVRAVMRVAQPTLSRGAEKPIRVGVWLRNEGRVIPFPTALCHDPTYTIRTGIGAPHGGSFFGLMLRPVAKDHYSFTITEERTTAPNRFFVSGDVWSGSVVRRLEGWAANLEGEDAGGSARLPEKPLVRSPQKRDEAPTTLKGGDSPGYP